MVIFENVMNLSIFNNDRYFENTTSLYTIIFIGLVQLAFMFVGEILYNIKLSLFR